MNKARRCIVVLGTLLLLTQIACNNPNPDDWSVPHLLERDGPVAEIMSLFDLFWWKR